VVGLLHLASVQAFNSTFSVNGGIVIQPLLGRQSLICTNRVHHGKVEVVIKIGETIVLTRGVEWAIHESV
jgi:hypothetical protein